MNNNELQIESLKNFILKIAGKQLNKTITNAVVEGIVTKVNENNSTYEVQPKNSNAAAAITATSLNDTIYQVNDLVYMISYEGNLSTVYHIFGSVKSVAEDFINLTLEDRFEADSFLSIKENDNFLSSKDTELNTEITDETCINQIKQKGCFKIEGKFKTSSNGTEEPDYGLKIELFLDEENKSVYYLNPPYFLGQPYNLDGSITQSRIVTLTQDEINKIQSIKVSTYSKNDFLFEYNDIKLSFGTLLNIEGTLNVLTTIENDKDYVSSRNLNDKAVVSVKVNYDGQELNSTLLSYYWVLKDENVKDENDDGYFSAVGAGWRCLNLFEEVSILGVDTKLRRWIDESRTFEFFPDVATGEEQAQLPHYENTLKCLVQFKDLTVESREFTIYNYDKEQFSATLVSNVEPASIISKTDSITLTCNLKNENKKWNEDDSSYKYIYTWFKDDDDYENGVNITPKAVDGTNINTNVLTVYGAETDKKVETSYIVTEDVENIYCKVTINKNGATVSTEETNKKTVTSYIGLESTIKKETFYKYYISTNMNVNFTQMASDEENEGSGTEWNGDWEIVDSSVGEGENPNWKSTKDDGTELKENDGYNVVFKDTSIIPNSFNINDDLYVYYTQKDVWTQEKMGESELIREENWSTPLIARGLDYNASNGGWYNSKEGAAAEKINTFNKLTNNGTLEGIQFDGDEAYINATYINTGVLRVGDENEEVFLATIEKNSEGKNPVKIAGFDVDQTSIQSNNGSIKLSSDNSNLENIAIQVGKKEKEKEYEFTITDVSEVKLAYKVITDQCYSLPYTKDATDVFIENILSLGHDTDTNLPILILSHSVEEGIDHYIYSGQYEYNEELYDKWDGIKNGSVKGTYLLTNKIVEKVYYPFQVTHEGNLHAENADITGRIVAEEGMIGNCLIKEGQLTTEKLSSISAELGSMVTGEIKSKNFILDEDDVWTVPWQRNQVIVEEEISEYSEVSSSNPLKTSFIIRFPKTFKIDISIPSDNKGEVKKIFTLTGLELEWNVSSYASGVSISTGDIGKNSDTATKIRNMNLSKGSMISGIFTYSGLIEIARFSKTGAMLEFQENNQKIIFPNFCLINTTEKSSGTMALKDCVISIKRSAEEESISIGLDGAATHGLVFAGPNTNVFEGQVADYTLQFTGEGMFYTRVTGKQGKYGQILGIKTYEDQPDFIPMLMGSWQIGSLESSSPITSDATKKNSIQEQPEIYSQIFDKLTPVIFKYNNGSSNRIHTGLIAQDVVQAVEEVGLTTQKFGAVCYDIDSETEEKKNYGVRYEELVSMCIYEIQQNKKQIKELQQKVEQLELELVKK